MPADLWYEIAALLRSQVNTEQLRAEINAKSSITVFCERVIVRGSHVQLWFDNAPSSSEVTSLETVLRNHDVGHSSGGVHVALSRPSKYAVSEEISLTTGRSWRSKVCVTFESESDKDIAVHWFAKLGNSSVNRGTQMRIVLDGETTLESTIAVSSRQDLYAVNSRLEFAYDILFGPKDATALTNVSGYRHVRVEPGQHDIKLEFAGITGTALIQNARLWIDEGVN